MFEESHGREYRPIFPLDFPRNRAIHAIFRRATTYLSSATTRGTETRLTYRWNIIIVKASAVASRRFWIILECLVEGRREEDNPSPRFTNREHHPLFAISVSFFHDVVSLWYISATALFHARYFTLLITRPIFLCPFLSSYKYEVSRVMHSAWRK